MKDTNRVKINCDRVQKLFMTFLQLKKIFNEKLKGKYVLFGNPADPASANTYWMRMNGIEGANVIGGHKESDTAVTRKLEMVMKKIQSKKFTVYNDEIAVRKAAEQNQEKKALEDDSEEVMDGAEVQRAPVAPALEEIVDDAQNESAIEQEIDINDFAIEEKEDQAQSKKDETPNEVSQVIAAEDIFENLDSSEDHEKDGDTTVQEDAHSDSEDQSTNENEKAAEDDQKKERRHLMSGLSKRGVHVGEVNPAFHATPPTLSEKERQEIEEKKRRTQEEKLKKEEQEEGQKRKVERKRRQEEQKERERLEHEQREKLHREAQEVARKEREAQKRIENEEKEVQRRKIQEEMQQRQQEKVKQEQSAREKTLVEETGDDEEVSDIFDSFTADRGASKIKPIERYDSGPLQSHTEIDPPQKSAEKVIEEKAIPVEKVDPPKVRDIPKPFVVPTVGIPHQPEYSFVKQESTSGELPLLDAIDLFWKDPHHAQTTNARDFIADVTKFSDHYFSHFSDEKMRIMYGWQTLRESASESFHVSPTFSACESQFGPKALNKYIHSLPNR